MSWLHCEDCGCPTRICCCGNRRKEYKNEERSYSHQGRRRPVEPKRRVRVPLAPQG